MYLAFLHTHRTKKTMFIETPLPINTETSNHDNNSKNATFNETDMMDPSESYHHGVSHTERTKVVSNRYSFPITLKFTTVTKEKTVNIAQKNVIHFAAIKLLDPSATIKSMKGVVY